MARICNAAVGAKARFYVQVFMQLDTGVLSRKFAEQIGAMRRCSSLRADEAAFAKDGPLTVRNGMVQPRFRSVQV
jgi:hypothetical protein